MIHTRCTSGAFQHNTHTLHQRCISARHICWLHPTLHRSMGRTCRLNCMALSLSGSSAMGMATFIWSRPELDGFQEPFKCAPAQEMHERTG